ncbi:MAG: transposase [Candidatus Heimdallarchaeum endolithica]|uniref:Transposase n=1 Tax=Candidatus Heimdallarchaeum endolithica TaxID=2876572 RepID=A0A9Y1BR73_9ARCH|nr:MAG: transposase [Candidatus Heimdallarchaeum endolithica]
MFTKFPLLVQVLVWDSKPRIVVTDAGVWYPVLLRLGKKILVVKSGLSSNIERFNATLKSYRWFHYILRCTYPISAVYGSTHLSGFLTLFKLHYNFVRSHQSLGYATVLKPFFESIYSKIAFIVIFLGTLDLLKRADSF